VLAWGSDNHGQLGDGTFAADRPTPGQVQLPEGTRVRGLFAGCQDGLVLNGSGHVLAWGSDGDGKLGDGAPMSDRPTPVRVKLQTGTKVTAISAGCTHSLALTASGKVLAWGDNSVGELGRGAGISSSPVPVRVGLPAGLAATTIWSGPMAPTSMTLVRARG
jgi:alpha-tubulin suppressor-like RCC1 family protein